MPRPTDDGPAWTLHWYCDRCGHTERYDPVTDGPLGPWAKAYPLLPRPLQQLMTRLRYALWRRLRNGCECSGKKP